ncbi:hypothetical protein EZV62_024408 [Acer yangbiense]|uniref:Growth-regulating factor n=1 Tax=Acer yangbiense TaxID=1000413 RepID=A0A5C7GV22_9ROSI|nr:hypothetical protein EZV62_024408 [Acer yangbiense]
MDEGDSRKSGGGGGTSDESNLCKKKKKMMMVHDHDDKSDDCGWRRCDGDVVGGGPTCNNNSRPRTSSSSSGGDVIGGSTVKTLQPFDNIGAAVPQTSFKSSDVGSGLNVIRFSNGGDLEPGRCRRTDGKKWRCSRDVAPDQKYCERHLHRGRHRSRKPVEQLPPKNNNNKTRLQSDPPPPSSSITQSYNHVKSTEKVTVFESLEQQRCLDNWMMNSSVYNQNYQPEPPLNLNCYTDIINPDLVASLENQHQTETPIRGFIDLWSNGVSEHDHNNNTNSGNSSSNGNLLLSPLSLSMGGSSSSNNTTTIDDEMGRIHMGLGVVQTDQDHECSTKLPFTSWLPPSSWAPGGPLAEVLRPSTVIQSNPPSPVATVNGDTLSSPSGVLQKTLASSWSDSSGSSSPTLASSNANNKPVELALLWLNQGKLSSSST